MRPRDEHGSVTPLIIGFAVVVALLVAAVVDASAAYLRRQGLNSAADAAALSATDGIQGEQVYTQGLGKRAEIDPAAARHYVAEYFASSGIRRRFPGLDYSVRTTENTVMVRVATPMDLPFRVNPRHLGHAGSGLESVAVDPVAEWLPGEERRDVVADERIGPDRTATGRVRSEHEVRGVPQRRVPREWLGRRDVQGRTRNVTRVQRGHESRLVHCAAPSDVDDVGVRRKCGKPLRVERIAGRLCCGQDHEEYVGAAQLAVELVLRNDLVPAASAGAPSDPANLRAELLQNRCQGLADVPEAPDEDASVEQRGDRASRMQWLDATELTGPSTLRLRIACLGEPRNSASTSATACSETVRSWSPAPDVSTTCSGKPAVSTDSGPARVCTHRRFGIWSATAAMSSRALPHTTNASASRWSGGTGLEAA